MIEFFIAKKHITERKKQSLVSILGVTIGITVLLVSIGISNGLDKNMINSILSLTSHVIVSDGAIINDYEELSEKLETLPEVKGVIPEIESQGLLKYNGPLGAYVSGVKTLGYDMDKAIELLTLDEKIIEGKIDKENMSSILVGKELATNTGMKVGDKIHLVSSENTDIEFEISGIFQSGFYDYDLNVVIINLPASQYMNYRGDGVDRLSVRLHDPYSADKVRNEIDVISGKSSVTWGEMNKSLLSALMLEKTVMILVFSLIVIIAGFVVWVTLNTLVREKIKDIGIMCSMGFSKKNIMFIFLIQGFLLGFIGMIIGIVLALAILWYLKNYSLEFITSIYYLTKVPIEISLKEIGIISGSNLFVILLSSVFPAYRAAKLENVEALRHD